MVEIVHVAGNPRNAAAKQFIDRLLYEGFIAKASPYDEPITETAVNISLSTGSFVFFDENHDERSLMELGAALASPCEVVIVAPTKGAVVTSTAKIRQHVKHFSSPLALVEYMIAKRPKADPIQPVLPMEGK